MKSVCLMVIVCASVLSACGPSTPATSSITPAPSTSTGTLPPELLPNPTPGLAQPPFESEYTVNQISPIFYGNRQSFILLGAIAQGNWLHPSRVYGLLHDDRMYDLYFDNEFIGSGKAHVKEPVNQGAPGTCDYYEVEQSLKVGEPPTFGFRQGHPVDIRPAEEIPVDNGIYQQYVLQWLALQEIPDPVVNITRILRVDVEGDGVDEVLISASHFTDETGHMVVVGDYSVVIMRKVVGNQVYTVPLVSDVYREDTSSLRFPPAYFLDNAFDLNGDGKLEVIVSGTWWEGSGVYVYETYGIGASEVLNVSCGLVTQN